MRKLTLNVASLQVESFETADDDAPRGTVRANYDGDSAGCTYWCTCTCTLEGWCCPSRGCDPTVTQPVDAETVAAAG